MTKINFVSLISRDDKPLYIQLFDVGDALGKDDANRFLKYNFLSHMALDVFLLPMSLNLREQQQPQSHDGILLLFIQDEVMVYGMETNNGLKIVVGVGEGEPLLADLKEVFSKLYKVYLRQICNPFTDLEKGEDVLQTKRFDSGVKAIVDAFPAKPVAP
ncbi:hypothetical protein C7M61_000052 [Candidozyma pseudohaemuli]|uniref:Trafficking protein particle complex subunit 2-like protein n=1 Tax=Candidozyma pseudohaemuli TaxID=418784 RepID=A0A2P7YWS9_9ASCO|nr:hypothetical protein C7M61_000052 [[Candida] pseudohaemulonii]PSK40415.1 hypothetical protein C7M61_000052 [[Candida] pseudohaemulonii]